jgi:NAD(P)-dependent dehydrogenase (short-subunit alcohol dehydrogenase family)
MMDGLFDITDKCIAITGGAGVLCGEMARQVAARGAKVCLIDYDVTRAKDLCREIEAAGGSAIPVQADVLDKACVQEAFGCAVASLGHIDVLINGAGGNRKEATCTPPEPCFFDVPAEAMQWVMNLNCLGTILPSQVFGRHMAQRGQGVIVNMSSMNAFRPLTRIAAYSAAKAAVSNFTLWLATYMCQNHSAAIRVNAIAPGFFLTSQNRFLLTDPDGSPTARGQQIIDHTPMGRYGEPGDLIGTLVWLISDASKFVTGIVVPVDGGFSAYSGV